jgi:hypothetical protein
MLKRLCMLMAVYTAVLLLLLQARYGGAEKYLNSIGFDSTWRAKLKAALTED